METTWGKLVTDIPEKHHRRSLRLSGYDYSQTGAYFVTMSTQQRNCLFGQIVGEKMLLNDAGQMIERWWKEIANKFPTVEVDEHIVMPNHFHGIIILVGATLNGRSNPYDDQEPVGAALRGSPPRTLLVKPARAALYRPNLLNWDTHTGVSLQESLQIYQC